VAQQSPEQQQQVTANFAIHAFEGIVGVSSADMLPAV
jgi:hypothetical protein